MILPGIVVPSSVYVLFVVMGGILRYEASPVSLTSMMCISITIKY